MSDKCSACGQEIIVPVDLDSMFEIEKALKAHLEKNKWQNVWDIMHGYEVGFEFDVPKLGKVTLLAKDIADLSGYDTEELFLVFSLSRADAEAGVYRITGTWSSYDGMTWYSLAPAVEKTKTVKYWE